MRSRMIVAVAALILASLPALARGQEAPPPIDCGPGDGRERLTTSGFEADFEAPAAKTYELTAATEHTKPLAQMRDAKFLFTGDFTPYTLATVKATLTWTEKGDFDLIVLGDDGSQLAIANQRTVFDPPETLQVDLAHCQDFTIVARSGPGAPNSMMTLDVTVEPAEPSETLRCAENDAAPGCAGKAAGEAPELVPDDRRRLYLGGDPGQVSMIYNFAGNESLPQGRLVASRPTGGQPNQYTRPLVGFRDQYRNPFVAHWTTTFAEPRTIAGTVGVALWASSTTADATGTLYVDVYADGGVIGAVTIPGDRIKREPTALLLKIPVAEPAIDVTSLSLQVATNPAASTNGPGNPADAHVTLFYDSVQFPARVTLP